MSIQELSIKFKAICQNEEYRLSALIVVVSLISFMLGRVGAVPQNAEIQPLITESEEESLRIPEVVVPPVSQAAVVSEKGYVASKNGTKYHLPWCGSAKQIKEENKVWFSTKEEAERAGYAPAASCKGI